jgi:hypothetical protein
MAQNAVQMAHHQTNSTSEAAKVCLIAETPMYVVDGVPCGPLLFKNMIKHTVLFNQSVKEIVAGLQAGGGQLTNWLLILPRHTMLSVILGAHVTCATREMIKVLEQQVERQFGSLHQYQQRDGHVSTAGQQENIGMSQIQQDRRAKERERKRKRKRKKKEKKE